jgi:hypothetical protein
VDPQAERAARNESLFREINERISEITREQQAEWTEAFCECSRLGCTEKVEISLDEYERVRARGDRFFLAGGHEQPEIERVLERNGRFTVVEKLGDGARVADDLDPRT